MNINRNSAIIWLPPIQDTLPVPKTIMVEYDHVQFVAALEGEDNKEYIGGKMNEIEIACENIGWPCFIKTDLTSAKHNGPSSYLATSKEDLLKVVMRTVEDSEMKLWPFARPTHFMIRRFLELNYSFTAFEDLPIAREFRLFADHTKVYCVHPYWPVDSLRFNKGKKPKDWERQLAKHHELPEEIQSIEEIAIKACTLINTGHIWSVDFAQDKYGNWWLIDMAHAEESYHWPGCVNEFGAE